MPLSPFQLDGGATGYLENAASPGDLGHGTISAPQGMSRDVKGTWRPRVAKPVGYREQARGGKSSHVEGRKPDPIRYGDERNPRHKTREIASE